MTTVRRNTKVSKAEAAFGTPVVTVPKNGVDAFSGIDGFEGEDSRSDNEDDEPTESLSVPLSQIEADDDFNARKIYRNIPKLAETIASQGLLQPLVVRRVRDTRVGKGGEYEPNRFALVAGFRRKRALDLLAKKAEAAGGSAAEIDPMIDVRVVAYDDRDDAMLGNLAADSATDPLRVYDLASRLFYLKKKYGSSHQRLAEISGKSTTEIGALIGCMEDLSPEVRKVWAQAPDPDTELPLSRLTTWRKHPPSEQKRLLEAYIAKDPKPVVASGDEHKEGGGKRIDGQRPTVKDLRAELVKVVEKLDDKPAPTQTERARLEAMSKTLRYCIGDISRLW